MNVTVLPACDDGQEPSASDADNALALPQHGALCQQTPLLPQPRLVSQPVFTGMPGSASEWARNNVV